MYHLGLLSYQSAFQSESLCSVMLVCKSCFTEINLPAELLWYMRIVVPLLDFSNEIYCSLRKDVSSRLFCPTWHMMAAQVKWLVISIYLAIYCPSFCVCFIHLQRKCERFFNIIKEADLTLYFGTKSSNRCQNLYLALHVSYCKTSSVDCGTA